MKALKHKYQEEYEKTNGCFWEPKPAKFVKLLGELLQQDTSKLKVLDLGAGEGKNSVYLANLGAEVLSVDISPIALSKFSLQPNYETSENRITILQSNILSLDFESNKFDIVIAYGILHCLASKIEIFSILKKIKSWIKQDGYFVCATFTDDIAPPIFQNYLEIQSFLSKDELRLFFNDWNILYSENGIIKESHPTSNIEHEHSLTRLIARKI